MTKAERDKREKVALMPTEALRFISENATERERNPDLDPVAWPLAGIVHIDTIGQVPFTWIEEELATR